MKEFYHHLFCGGKKFPEAKGRYEEQQNSDSTKERNCLLIKKKKLDPILAAGSYKK